MKNLLIIPALLICFAASGQQLLPGEVLQYKDYSDSTGNYMIQYKYNPDHAEIVATNPPSEPHYEAVITVFEIKGNDTTQVYQPLRGVYVAGECVCDNPAKIVERHKKLKIAEQ